MVTTNYTLRQGRIDYCGEEDSLVWQHTEGSVAEKECYFYKKDASLYLHCEMFARHGTYTTPVIFEYTNGTLKSYSNEQTVAMRDLILFKDSNYTDINDSIGILIELLANDIEHSISLLSHVHKALDNIGENILLMTSDSLAKETLQAIHEQESVNSLIRENSIDTHRIVSFLMKSKMLNAEQLEHCRLIMHDVESCDTNTAFIFDKVNFLINNIVSIVNINQSRIIKIFSVVNVALMPPTLVASIYGMNLVFPELETLGIWSYPWTVFLMILSAAIPMILFARKGWLR